MPDRLYEAIAEALARPLDGNVFERCAVDLLRDNYYSSLRPVEGGDDAGMDGAGALDDGERFFLVCTVAEDARSNLDRNVRSHIAAGGDRRTVVFATSRKITGQRQLELARHLDAEFGFRLAEVHDRSDFVQMLYRNSAWRKELLGIPGMARALTRIPKTRRPMPEIPLIGRESDVAQLRSLSGDVILVGKPGIGKTYLLQQMTSENWGLFDDGWQVTDLEDAIRDMQPARVIVDDAHLNEDRLSMLRQLRLQTSASFGIVAVSWPGQKAKVAAALGGSTEIEIAELDRDQILEVVTATGVVGPRELQANLVDQSLGRAGLAVTLAHSCITGHVNQVASGQALLDDVVGWFARSMGADSRFILGVLALSGESGATIAQVADVLGLSKPRVSDLVRGLASGGTLDEAPGGESAIRLRVQPETLRYALVKDVFLSGPGSLEVSDAIAQLDRASAAVVPLIGAAHRGANVDRRLLLNLLDPADQRAVVAFASLGPSETSTALDLFPKHRGTIARASYSAGINPERTLRVLMELAVGDDRDERSAPDHPLRVVSDQLHGPNGDLNQRALAVSICRRWLEDGKDALVGFRVLMHAVHPGGRRTYSDPGFGRTFTIVESTLPIEMVLGLGQLWDTILDIVEQARSRVVAPIIDGLHAWAYPGSLAMGKGADQVTTDAMREIASRVISRLIVIWANRPGALHRLREYVENTKLALVVEIPSEFDVLYPRDWDGSDEKGGHAAWWERAQNSVRELAAAYGQVSAAELARRMKSADTEAGDARVNYPRLTPYLAQTLASHCATPTDFLKALKEQGAVPDLLFPFLNRLVEIKQDGWQDSFESYLSDDRWANAAIQTALTKDVGEEFKERAIHRMTSGHSRMVEFLIAREEIDPNTIERLLNASDPAIARTTAVAVAQPGGAPDLTRLNPSARVRWREVIVQSPADEYWYAVILKRDLQLLAAWLRGWVARIAAGTGESEILPDQLLDVITGLPVDIRLELLGAMPSGVPSILLQDVVASLVSDDAITAEALLSRGDLQNLHSAALRGGPTAGWMERALVALRRGWDPYRIVAQTRFDGSMWAGEESAHWQQKIEAFERLRKGDNDADRLRIIEAGIALFEDLKARALAAERRERVFGDFQ